MNKKELSAIDISKKLIWEYIVAAFIFGVINYFIISFVTRNMENAVLELSIQIILSSITVFLYVCIGSKNVIQRYFIRKEDIRIIIRNISIFFIIMVVIGTIENYNSYQKLMQKEARIYSIVSGYNVNDIINEVISRDEKSVNYPEIYNTIKEKEEEKFKKDFSKRYGYIVYVPTIYNIVLYVIMIFLQRRWLLKAAE